MSERAAWVLGLSLVAASIIIGSSLLLSSADRRGETHIVKSDESLDLDLAERKLPQSTSITGEGKGDTPEKARTAAASDARAKLGRLGVDGYYLMLVKEGQVKTIPRRESDESSNASTKRYVVKAQFEAVKGQ